jgi:hypothetical protein
MEIYIKGDRAFVDIGSGYMLCIGSKDNIKGATDRDIQDMVMAAIAYNKFLGMTSEDTTIN